MTETLVYSCASNSSPCKPLSTAAASELERLGVHLKGELWAAAAGMSTPLHGEMMMKGWGRNRRREAGAQGRGRREEKVREVPEVSRCASPFQLKRMMWACSCFTDSKHEEGCLLDLRVLGSQKARKLGELRDVSATRLGNDGRRA